ncbi:LamG-like jellyroll fold domain-containing protein [Marinobacter sp. X15-166B]|uniref:LamG-like jellyroll fold domain-containing protein n=1 Tax=Marinobacter sp. X15-166B TaxID=1897620 RepID=UPI00085C3A35|nr:LamG-like jellyroll fold domain-containing protein [Marinobacter sp. X15-166B]OEY66795.1 hypothetical protein BG841_10240 [Marinobacter sp. X15-166B]
MEGKGTAQSPYLIATAEDLIAMVNDPHAIYELAADITLPGPWAPLRFYGKLDGKGHTISNLEVVATDGADHYGFFSQLLSYAEVRNLNLITNESGVRGSSSKYGGVLAGLVDGSAVVERVCAIGVANHGGSRGAGLLGYVTNLGIFRETATFVVVPSGSWGTAVISNGSGSGAFYRNSGVWSSEYSTRASAGPSFVGVNLTVAQAADPANYPEYFDFDNYWEIVDGLPRVKKMKETGDIVSPQTALVSGIVQIDGTPAEREVRAYGYDPTIHDIDGATINLSKSLGHATSDPQTGEYSIDLLGGYGDEVFVVAFDDYGMPFTPDMAVNVGDRVHPSTPNGHVWETTGAGNLPAEEPVWIVDTETSQPYGTAAMIARPFYRPMVHGPVAPEVTVTVAGDPHWGKVTLLMRMDGPTLEDISENPAVITPRKGASISPSGGVFGGSVHLDGSNGTRVETDRIPDIGSGPFTLEAFMKVEGAQTGRIVSAQSQSNPNPILVLRVNSDQSLLLYMRSAAGGDDELLYSPAGVVDVTGQSWHHVAATRDAQGVAKIWLDGSEVASMQSAVDTSGTAPWWIGAFHDTSEVFKGYIDEVRITEGVARYTEYFTPPTEPSPNFAPVSNVWTPAELILADDIGAMYDVSDLSTLFQDVNGTMPVTSSGQRVALMRDLSGQNNHALQNDEASRPVYQTDGTRHWLEANGEHYMVIAGSKSGMRFLHDGTAMTTMMSVWVDPTGSAGTTHGLLGANQGTSAHRGMYYAAVNDSPSTNSFTFSYFAAKSQSHSSRYADYHHSAEVDPLEASLLELTVNTAREPDVSHEINGVNTGTYNLALEAYTGDATFDYELFSLGGGTYLMEGRFYGALIIDRLLTPEETLEARQFFMEKASG